MIYNIFAGFFLFVGSGFIFLGLLGVYRMPDVFNKIQAGTKATTLGFVSLCLGMIFLMPEWWLKLTLIAIFILASNPIGSHAISRATKKTNSEMKLYNEGENK